MLQSLHKWQLLDLMSKLCHQYPLFRFNFYCTIFKTISAIQIQVISNVSFKLSPLENARIIDNEFQFNPLKKCFLRSCRNKFPLDKWYQFNCSNILRIQQRKVTPLQTSLAANTMWTQHTFIVGKFMDKGLWTNETEIFYTYMISSISN